LWTVSEWREGAVSQLFSLRGRILDLALTRSPEGVGSLIIVGESLSLEGSTSENSVLVWRGGDWIRVPTEDLERSVDLCFDAVVYYDEQDHLFRARVVGSGSNSGTPVWELEFD
jgi:hypothetical protein